MPDAKWCLTNAGRGLNAAQSQAMWRIVRRPESATLEDIIDLFFYQPGQRGMDLVLLNDPYDMDFEDAQSWAEVERAHAPATHAFKAARMTQMQLPFQKEDALLPFNVPCLHSSHKAIQSLSQS